MRPPCNPPEQTTRSMRREREDREGGGGRQTAGLIEGGWEEEALRMRMESKKICLGCGDANGADVGQKRQTGAELQWWSRGFGERERVSTVPLTMSVISGEQDQSVLDEGRAANRKSGRSGLPRACRFCERGLHKQPASTYTHRPPPHLPFHPTSFTSQPITTSNHARRLQASRPDLHSGFGNWRVHDC